MAETLEMLNALHPSIPWALYLALGLAICRLASEALFGVARACGSVERAKGAGKVAWVLARLLGALGSAGGNVRGYTRARYVPRGKR